MHVCDFNNFYSSHGGGVKTYHDQKLGYFLSHPEHEYTLIFPGRKEAVREYSKRVRVVQLPGLKVDSNYRLVLNAVRLRRHLLNLRPDLIEVGEPYLAPWVTRVATCGSKTPLVCFWHANYPIIYVQRAVRRVSRRLAPAATAVSWWYARQTFHGFAGTFAAAKYMVSELESHGMGPVFHTPLGVDTSKFSPHRREMALRASVGALGERPLLFFSGRLSNEKGLDLLIEAFPLVYEACRPVLVVAGEGPGEERLRDLCRRIPDVRYLGYVADPDVMARWYASADVTLAFSPYETFGLSAAEAVCSGCALVAADGGSLGELVNRTACGALFAPGDAKALASSLIGLLQDPGALARSRANARSAADKELGWEEVFDRMLAAYEGIVQER